MNYLTNTILILQNFQEGREGGSDPLDLQRCQYEVERMAKPSVEPPSFGPVTELDTADEPAYGYNSPGVDRTNSEAHTESESLSDFENEARDDSESSYDSDDEEVDGESESLSDIDDEEVDVYLHNKDEKHFKKIIWEMLNKDYLKKQAEKKAVAALEHSSAVEKSRKKRQQKQVAEAKISTPPQTEAPRQEQTKKRLSSKVNYDVLAKLFDEPVAPEKPKKSRSESHSHDDITSQMSERKLESEYTYEDGEDDYEFEGHTGGANGIDYETIDGIYEGCGYNDF